MPFLGTRIQPKTRFGFLFNRPPPPSSSSLHSRKLFHRTLIMSSTMTQSNKSKRPICPSCSKPARTCLCSRIRVSGIENSVKVTILHHALESKHPLNSTRIAKLGLKNLTVATVSDVNFGARFVIRLIDPKYCKSGSSVRNVRRNGLLCRQFEKAGGTRKLFCEKDCNLVDSSGGKCGLENGVCEDDDDCAMVNGEVGEILVHSDSDPNCGVYGETKKLFAEEDFNLVDSARKVGLQSYGALVNGEVEKSSNIPSFDTDCAGTPAITFNIGKYGKVSSLSHIWMSDSQSSWLSSFDYVLDHDEACEALSKGFLVKKFQSRKLDNRGIDLEEFEEFEIEVPPGSALLFPSDKAVTIGELDAIGFEVKNLIVLDGTWSKAKRVYSENPWLNVLPHLKLEVNEMSLYSDVRHQPKAGYLSTIESIVHALKAFGEENHEDLDRLLDTFEAMVGDQRRCKDERLSKTLP
ncbi:hypothetical protein HN51_023789 [Arachis hypogaea]|uniref:tRNA-uridine aminocarboxypropyltransferase n=1 Tax=Arachis hypogaea TaxID=3818 RepID=A0A445C3I0_ARAHY|nr:uncharacterized protein LOC112701972 [Arachis hypogaea]RYR45487.1 hypothetical protein Ahy_A07g031313 [Arachis hypogaea]